MSDLYLLKTDSLGSYSGMGLPEFSDDKKMILFPNPSKGSVTIRFSSETNKGTLRIYNSLGQQVSEVNDINAKEIKINKGEFGSGIYFVQLIQKEKLIASDKLLLID